MTGALTAATWLVAATTTKKSSGLNPIIIIYAVIAAAFYFLYYRPRKRKAQEAREQGNAWEVGDEVLTAGGIVGYIIDVDGDRVTLETSVGASFVVLKQYVIRKIDPVVTDDDEEGVDDEDELEAQDQTEGESDHDEGGDEGGDEDETDHDDHDGGDHEPADDEPDGTGSEASPGAGTGNRRARRRGLRNQSEGGEDPSDNDGPPTA